MKIFISFFSFYLLLSSCSTVSTKRVPASERPQIKVSEFAAQLDREGKLEPLMMMAQARLKELVPHPKAQIVFMQQLEKIRREKDWQGLDRFPVIPLSHVKTLRPALGGLRDGDKEKVIVQRFSGRLEDLFAGPCTKSAGQPKKVFPEMPEITDGHFPDTKTDRCVIHQSFVVAQVLNSLVRSDGSEVRFRNERARSTQKFFEILMNSGHRIEMKNERMFANFLSLNVAQTPIIWPVWMDTGVKLSDGTSLNIPVGHSHHAWYISGPLVNAKIMFYLGVSGVGFFPQASERPAWTGTRASYVVDSSSVEGRAAILKAAEVAGKYYRRTFEESEKFAKGMPANGYGYLGVCNDSNAVIEYLTAKDSQNRPSVSVFPLMRAAELDAKANQNDGLDMVFRNLPKDTEPLKFDRTTLRRIYEMSPFENLDDPRLHDETLRRQWKQLSLMLE